MKIIRLLLFILLAVSLLFCSNASKEIFDSAALEEKQGNYAHAVKLYEEIVSKYPATPEAHEANKRLSAIQGAKQ